MTDEDGAGHRKEHRMAYSADEICQRCGVVRPCCVHDQAKPVPAGTEVRRGVFVGKASSSIFLRDGECGAEREDGEKCHLRLRHYGGHVWPDSRPVVPCRGCVQRGQILLALAALANSWDAAVGQVDRLSGITLSECATELREVLQRVGANQP